MHFEQIEPCHYTRTESRLKFPSIRFDKERFFYYERIFEHCVFGVLAIIVVSMIITGEVVKHFGGGFEAKKESTVFVKHAPKHKHLTKRKHKRRLAIKITL